MVFFFFRVTSSLASSVFASCSCTNNNFSYAGNHNVELFDRKNNVVEVITERDSDRKTVQDMTRNITVRDQVLNIDRKQKLNLSLVELDRHVDRKPDTGSVVDNLDLDDMIIVRDTQAETQTFAKLKPRTVIRANQAQDDCWEEGSRKMKQEEAGGEEEEEGGGGRGKDKEYLPNSSLEPSKVRRNQPNLWHQRLRTSVII